MTQVFYSDIPQPGTPVNAEEVRANFEILSGAASLFATEQLIQPSLFIEVGGGSYYIGGIRHVRITPPTTFLTPLDVLTGVGAGAGKKRIALLSIDSAGGLHWTYGSWTLGTPIAPTCPASQIPICEVFTTYGMLTITSLIMTDARPSMVSDGGAGAGSLQVAYNGGQLIDESAIGVSVTITQTDTTLPNNVLDIVNSGNGSAITIIQDNTASTANVIDITNSGSGYDIEGDPTKWFITKNGVIACQGITGPNLIGATGAQGITGLGATGVQGIQGNTGVQGIQGNTGFGVQGNTGIQGIQGIQGVTGIHGFSGIQGIQGDTGIQGVTGIQGIAGTGTSGVPGPQGVTGLQGIQGNTGLSGTIGIDGVTGLQGQTGLAGTNGSAGAQGQTGVQGAQGNTGLQGVQGLQGNTGVQGLQGNTGIGTQGTTGIQGSQGNTGLQGQTGPGGAGGTLNDSYDFGGAGLGRIITADAGAVEIVCDTTTTSTIGNACLRIFSSLSQSVNGIEVKTFNGTGIVVQQSNNGSAIDIAQGASAPALLIDYTGGVAGVGIKVTRCGVNICDTISLDAALTVRPVSAGAICIHAINNTGAGDTVVIEVNGTSGTASGKALVINSTTVQNTIVVTHSGNSNVLTMSKVTAGTGNVIDITNSGTGKDIDGTGGTWHVDKAGESVFAGATIGGLILVATNKTISSDAIAVTSTQCFLRIDTEGGATNDDLVNITGGVDGQILILCTALNSHDVSVKATGNIALTGAPRGLGTQRDRLMLQYDSSEAKWCEISFGNNP